MITVAKPQKSRVKAESPTDRAHNFCLDQLTTNSALRTVSATARNGHQGRWASVTVSPELDATEGPVVITTLSELDAREGPGDTTLSELYQGPQRCWCWNLDMDQVTQSCEGWTKARDVAKDGPERTTMSEMNEGTQRC